MIFIHNAKVFDNMKTGIANVQFSNAPVPMSMIKIYSALHIYHGLFSHNNSWETLIACPLGLGMVSFMRSNLTKVLPLNAVCCVRYRVIWYCNILRIYSIMSIKFAYCWKKYKNIFIFWISIWPLKKYSESALAKETSENWYLHYVFRTVYVNVLVLLTQWWTCCHIWLMFGGLRVSVHYLFWK